ncbi:Lrp/AsnC family transcriptional regulator [Streptomyces carpinensis]|uniref:Lrp/AsnC family transcriptional regulator n=1 Tax=Streptomyces carpinensis TaxID=66369 RepID=A0ABV1W856_9ACTN|nr:Lrp/AsnC family transcriptional regulator [Streptomyces carpinensis]
MVDLPLDTVDTGVLAALQANPRASWGQIARALEASESTVARRATRLFDSGLVRVIGVVDVLRCGVGVPALVRLQCTPGSSNAVAEKVAAHSQVRFAAVVAGSADVVAEVVLGTHDSANAVIDEELGKLPGVAGTETSFVMSTFVSNHDWGRHLLPDPQLVEGLKPPEPTPAQPHEGFTQLEQSILDALADNGRLSYTALASTCGVSESIARRRTDSLVDRGCLRFRTLVEPQLLGYEVEFDLLLTVAPAQLLAACEQLARCPDVRYLSAVTGPANISAQIALRRYQEIFGFLNETVGALPGVHTVETMVSLRVLKRAFAEVPPSVQAAPPRKRGNDTTSTTENSDD